MVASIQVLGAACTPALVEASILDRVAECIPVQGVVSILVLVGVYIQVLVGGYTLDQVAECTLGQENHTKATFLLGKY